MFGTRIHSGRRFKVALVATLLATLPGAIALLIRYDVPLSILLVLLVLFYCILFIVRAPYLSLAIVLIPLTVFDATQVLVHYRMSVEGFPIGMIDAGLALVALGTQIGTTWSEAIWAITIAI